MNRTLNYYHTGGVMGDGIFSALSKLQIPWDKPSDELDMEYYNNHSGDKIASNLTVNISDLDTLASIIYHKFIAQWLKLWNTTELEYDPIENYNMTETLSENHNATSDNSETITNNVNTTAQTDIYGYNLDSAPSDKTDSKSTAESKKTDKSTDTSTDSHELHRSGNIGVTTSQQLIQSERDLYMWNFYEHIFKDVDTVITLPIYE